MSDRCQIISQDLEEPLPGTAAVARAWLLVEDDGPWGPDALTMSTVPEAVAAKVGADAEAAGVRVQLVRRVDRQRSDAERRTVFLCRSGPSGAWVRRLLLTDDELAALDLSLAHREQPPTDVGLEGVACEPVEDDLLLVCTHAKRDACCAQFGRPVAEAVAKRAPEQTWETSHTGGHRFAATMIVLPDGLTFGRLEPRDVTTLVNALGNGRIPLANYRGRSVDSGPEQSAEVAVREAAGASGRDAARVVDSRVDGGATVVTVEVDGAPWRAVVASRPLGTLRSISCGGTPEDRASHQVVSVGPATPVAQA